MKKVAIIMGSDSDWPVVKGACTVLKDFGVPYEAHILSAHRTPEETAAFAVLSVCDVVLRTTREAQKQYPGLEVVFSGGVANNEAITDIFAELLGKPVTAGHCADAQRLSRGYRSAERREERRVSGCGDSGRGRRRAGREA